MFHSSRHVQRAPFALRLWSVHSHAVDATAVLHTCVCRSRNEWDGNSDTFYMIYRTFQKPYFVSWGYVHELHGWVRVWVGECMHVYVHVCMRMCRGKALISFLCSISTQTLSTFTITEASNLPPPARFPFLHTLDDDNDINDHNFSTECLYLFRENGEDIPTQQKATWSRKGRWCLQRGEPDFSFSAVSIPSSRKELASDLSKCSQPQGKAHWYKEKHPIFPSMFLKTGGGQDYSSQYSTRPIQTL